MHLKSLIFALILSSNAIAAGTPTPPPPRPTARPASVELPLSTQLKSKIEYSDEVLDQGMKPKVVILLDGSGSMGQLLDKKKSKMYYAKNLFYSYLKDQWREKAEVGMIVYGSRRKDDCADYYFAVPFGERNLTKLDDFVRKLSPTGMTPIADSLELALKNLKDYPGPKRVMIFTDGEETCGGDSCLILQKAIQDKIYDLEMFVTGIGMSEKSKDLDHLRCLGKTFGATSPEQLKQNLDDISDMMGSPDSSKGGVITKNNLFVVAPDPHIAVRLFAWKNGQKEYLRDFVSSYGVKVPPGDYAAEVMLDPIFHFPKFTVPAGKKVTLKVEGEGLLHVKFYQNLLDVDVLDVNKKVVKSFPSDEPNLVKSGVHDVHIFGNPFYDQYERNVKIIPGAKLEIEVTGAGILQIDHPSVVGFHVFDGSDKDIGSYMTNFPFVLKTGTYRFYINEKCKIDGIQVRHEKSLRRLSCDVLKQKK